MKTYKATSKYTEASRGGKCHFCEKHIKKGEMIWWYPNSKRAFHPQCKGISKASQKGVTSRIMTPEELNAYHAARRG
jgi:hypothetical protein